MPPLPLPHSGPTVQCRCATPVYLCCNELSNTIFRDWTHEAHLPTHTGNAVSYYKFYNSRCQNK